MRKGDLRMKRLSLRKRPRVSTSSNAVSGKDYYDMCFEVTPDTSIVKIQDASRRLFDLGYMHVMWNETVTGRDGVRSLGKNAKIMKKLLEAAQGPNTPRGQYRRVTVVVEDAGDAQFLCGNIRSLACMDLVAARPSSEAALSFLCESSDVDVISLDVTGGSRSLSLTNKHVTSAAARGIFFEICYHGVIEADAAGPAGASSSSIKLSPILATITSIVNVTDSKGLIWSSGCENMESLRGVHDIVNLLVVLGGKEENAFKAVSDNCRAALHHARARKLEYLPVEEVV